MHNLLVHGPSGTRQGFRYQSIPNQQQSTPFKFVQTITPHDGRSEAEIMNSALAWLPYGTQTSSHVVQLFRESPVLLEELAGAVLALHQDTHMGFGIDLNRTDDVVWNAAMDKVQPNRLGKFPDRVMSIMRLLPKMDNAWLDAIAAGAPEDMDQKVFQVHAITFRMRSTASRIWLMTMMGKQPGTQGGDQVLLSIATIWQALSVITPDKAAEGAAGYVGTFYDGVQNRDINARAWKPESHFPV